MGKIALLFRLAIGLSYVSLLIALSSCIDQLDLGITQHLNVVVVDGFINNLAEAQVIQLSRAKSDSLTGRAGFLAIKGATVEVVVDSSVVIACHETTDGRYELPSDFKGQVGHAYQLRFTLSDGTQYRSTQQVMQPVAAIGKLSLRFNPNSLPAGLLDNYRSGYDVLVDFQDPASQRNYYRWDWTLFEKQYYCARCIQGYYMTNQLKLVSSYPDILVYQAQPDPLEACFAKPSTALFGGSYTRIPSYFINSYVCRSDCWSMIHNSDFNVFSDGFSNGGLIINRNVGQIPHYTENPALVEIRQRSLTADAYGYFDQLAQQTQGTGNLTDPPPTTFAGNVTNVAHPAERVIGYFTAGAVVAQRYWLNKKDATSMAYGSVYYDEIKKLTLPVPEEQQLFYAFNNELPKLESYLNFTVLGDGLRPPTAICSPSDSQTPVKPVGWRE